MDSFDFDNVKAEKVKAMRRYNRLRSLAKVFRVLELLLVLLFLVWTFRRLPFAVKISGEFVFKLGGVIASPLFVFIVCNVIIITLIVKSGIFSAVNNADSKLYEEIIRNSENCSKSEPQEEIVYQEKEIISQVTTSTPTCEEMEPTPELELDSESDSDSVMDNPRVYRRCKSEKLAVKKSDQEAVKKELRRSETEKCHKIEQIDEELFPEDKMSNEEFNRTIEDFIAKQLRIRRQESLSIVLPSQA